jgi:hypothetical protein
MWVSASAVCALLSVSGLAPTMREFWFDCVIDA